MANRIEQRNLHDNFAGMAPNTLLIVWGVAKAQRGPGARGFGPAQRGPKQAAQANAMDPRARLGLV